MQLASGGNSTPLSKLPAIAMNVVKTRSNDEKLGRVDTNPCVNEQSNKINYNKHIIDFNSGNNDAN